MRVLGVDPGTVTTGYGIIDEEGSHLSLVSCGVLVPPPKTPIEKKLFFLYTGLVGIISCFQPNEVSVEEPFVGRNVRSALVLGRVQAIAMLAAANSNLPVYRYSPKQAKQQVTSYGNSSKEMVQEMVKIQLGLSSLPQPTDVSDALAIAICHLNQTHLTRLTSDNRDEER